jgi:hypothetical protein
VDVVGPNTTRKEQESQDPGITCRKCYQKGHVVSDSQSN